MNRLGIILRQLKTFIKDGHSEEDEVVVIKEGKEIKEVKRGGILKLFTFKEELGRGTTGTVYRVVRKSDAQSLAIKVIEKRKLSSLQRASLQSELDIMERINHVNCVRLEAAFESPDRFYIVFELLTGGELFARIATLHRLSERDIAGIMRQIASAVHYLHSHDIVHRDIKPENLVFDSPEAEARLKLVDFALAKCGAHETQEMFTHCGTPQYVAPEVICSDPYNHAADMWSIGVILYSLLCGKPPFSSAKSSEMFALIRRGRYELSGPYWDEVSPPAKALISGLLHTDPRRRLTAEQLLGQPWMTNEIDRPLNLALARFKLLRRENKIK